MAGSPKKRARRERVASASDPLDESYVPPRAPLSSIPYNKVTLTDEGREAVAQALLDGYPRNQIAKALGTTVATVRRIIKDDPALIDVVDARNDVEEQELRDILMGLARKGDTVAAIFMGKSQFGWRDRDDSKIKLDTGDLGGVLVVPGPQSLEDWSISAAKQQAQYRNAPDVVKTQLDDAKREAERQSAPNPGTPGIEGLRLVKPAPGELPH